MREEVELEFGTINGGKVARATQRAIEAAVAHIGENEDLKGARKIVITISLSPTASGMLETASKVDQKFPNEGSSGVAWMSNGVPVTELKIIDKTGQTDFLSEKEMREAEAIRKADVAERLAKQQHAMELRRAEAEDREFEAARSAVLNPGPGTTVTFGAAGGPSATFRDGVRVDDAAPSRDSALAEAMAETEAGIARGNTTPISAARRPAKDDGPARRKGQ